MFSSSINFNKSITNFFYINLQCYFFNLRLTNTLFNVKVIYSVFFKIIRFIHPICCFY